MKRENNANEGDDKERMDRSRNVSDTYAYSGQNENKMRDANEPFRNSKLN